MGKLLKELRKFLSTATQEQLEKAWKEVEQFKGVGPTITEYIENMKEIKEDYVSFEVAKLLKEKGFDVPCECAYSAGGQYLLSCYKGIANRKIKNDEALDFSYSSTAPTLQIAMKWLREMHNLSVEVYRTACGYVGCIVSIPSGTDIKFLEEDGDDLPSGQYTTWEKACEAALKYSLENLI